MAVSGQNGQRAGSQRLTRHGWTAGPGFSTLPVVIFSKVRLGVSPKINALAIILVGRLAIGTILAGVDMNRQMKNRERDMQMATADN